MTGLPEKSLKLKFLPSIPGNVKAGALSPILGHDCTVPPPHPDIRIIEKTIAKMPGSKYFIRILLILITGQVAKRLSQVSCPVNIRIPTIISRTPLNIEISTRCLVIPFQNGTM